MPSKQSWNPELWLPQTAICLNLSLFIHVFCISDLFFIDLVSFKVYPLINALVKVGGWHTINTVDSLTGCVTSVTL